MLTEPKVLTTHRQQHEFNIHLTKKKHASIISRLLFPCQWGPFCHSDLTGLKAGVPLHIIEKKKILTITLFWDVTSQ
jgi:hypothetical protein